MEFRTQVDIPKPGFLIEPREELLFVGSCFADSIGQRFVDNQFRAVVNPYGTMYNPASVLHTVERWLPLQLEGDGGRLPRIVFLTLGTNHVYRLKETGEIVDNCQKRPASLFQVFTVSPIRYRKYGYHGSQLSKATLLLAVHQVISHLAPRISHLEYFPAYEILMDELRDYRFYADDMLHPSSQAVEYIWQQLVAHYFSPRAKEFLREWTPLKAALNHRPFNPDSDEYRQFLADTHAKIDDLLSRYPAPTAPEPAG